MSDAERAAVVHMLQAMGEQINGCLRLLLADAGLRPPQQEQKRRRYLGDDEPEPAEKP